MVRTQRRDDVLRAVVDAAEGTLVPSELPDQAGAVRDLVAAMKRSPTSETRTADLVPRGWIPALAAALAAARATPSRARARRWSAWRAAAVRPARSRRSGPPPATARWRPAIPPAPRRHS